MSFVHFVHVGFFGTPEERHPIRALEREECLEWMQKYNEAVEPALQIEIDPDMRPDTSRGVRLGYADGFGIGLTRGLVSCPRLSTQYHRGAICFAIFLSRALGCSMYSYDDGNFLTPEQLWPGRSFAAEMHEVIERRAQSGETGAP